MKGTGGEIPTLVRILDRSILLLEEKICWASILFSEAEELLAVFTCHYHIDLQIRQKNQVDSL